MSLAEQSWAQHQGQQRHQDAGTPIRRDVGPGEEGREGAWGSVPSCVAEDLLSSVNTAWLPMLSSPSQIHLPKSTFGLSCLSDVNRVFILQSQLKMLLDFAILFLFVASHLWGGTGCVGKGSLRSRLPHTLHIPPGWHFSSEF